MQRLGLRVTGPSDPGEDRESFSRIHSLRPEKYCWVLRESSQQDKSVHTSRYGRSTYQSQEQLV